MDWDWDWELIIKVVGLGSVVVALVQWRAAQKWRQAEYLDGLSKEFDTEPRLVLAAQLLDWSSRQVQRPDGTKIMWRTETVLDALRIHTEYDEAKLRFRAPQPEIRDAFDALLTFWERLETSIAGELVDADRAVHYFRYWLERMNRMDQHTTDRTPDAADRMGRYERKYGRHELLNALYRRASLNERPNYKERASGPEPLCDELVPDTKEDDWLSDGQTAKAIAYDNDHAPELLSVVRTNLRTLGNGAAYADADIPPICAYQRSRGLIADGQIGRATRYALENDFVKAIEATGLWAPADATTDQRAEHYHRVAGALGASGRRLVLGIRGIKLCAPKTHAVTSSAAYDDAFVLLIDGACKEFVGATHPYQRQGEPGLPVAMIRPGAYRLVPNDRESLLVIRPDGDGRIPCFRDFNGDGAITQDEIDQSETATTGQQVLPGIGTYATAILFHPGFDAAKSSIGCQTAPPAMVDILREHARQDPLLYLVVDARDAIAVARGVHSLLAGND